MKCSRCKRVFHPNYISLCEHCFCCHGVMCTYTIAQRNRWCGKARAGGGYAGDPTPRPPALTTRSFPLSNARTLPEPEPNANA